MSMLKTQPVRQAKSQSNPKPPMPERRVESGGASEDEIRPLAYRKWQQSGCPISDGVEFWLAAETEILRGRRR